MHNLSIDAVNKLLDDLHKTQQDILFSHQELFKIPENSVIPTLKKVCKDISELMNCERVEIWLFNEERTQLKVDVSYDQRGTVNWHEEIILKENVPTYFNAIVDTRTLAISDLSESPIGSAIREQLSSEYKDLQSMLDASILGKLLNLKTIAEGVETKEDWNQLQQLQCDDLQ